MILADSNVESKINSDESLISKAGSASPRSPRSDNSIINSSGGGPIPLTTTIRAPDNRNKASICKQHGHALRIMYVTMFIYVWVLLEESSRCKK